MAKPTKKAVIEAIEGSGGIMSTIAKKLSVTWHTAKSYVETWPETQQAFQDEREKIVDMAEATLFKSIREGDTGDAKWVLSRLGKDRGYVERKESTGADGKPHQVEVSLPEWVEQADPKALSKYLDALNELEQSANTDPSDET